MKKIFLLITVYCLLSTTTPVFAQTATEYQLLTPLPDYVKETSAGKTTAGPYIEGIFMLMIAVAGGLAVLMLIFGGIKYMSTDAFGGKNEAKNIIQNAIWGFILAISAWLILNTINPNLTIFKLEIPTQEIKTVPVIGVIGTGPKHLQLTQQQALDTLKGANIDIVDGINLAGVRQGTVDEIILLKNACNNCDVTVTSATGGDHASGACSHANGYKIDLRLNNDLANYINRNFISLPDRSDGAKMYQAPTGAIYALEGNHWDVTVCSI